MPEACGGVAVGLVNSTARSRGGSDMDERHREDHRHGAPGPDGQPVQRGPLAGIRVVELAGIGPAPFCAMMLADQGATVLRIDRPERSSGFPPEYFGFLNRGRQSAVLDLKHPLGVDALLRLLDAADVLVEGLRPGVTERLSV